MTYKRHWDDKKEGLTPLYKRGNSGCHAMEIDGLFLKAGSTYSGDTAEMEYGLTLLGGTCTVKGAADETQAETIAKSVIGSSLTKCAIFGADANWGRVLCAMGYSGAEFDPEKVDVHFTSASGDILVCSQGRGVDFDEIKAKKILTEHDVEVNISMGEGKAACTCWGCDMTYDYVKINGDYRT